MSGDFETLEINQPKIKYLKPNLIVGTGNGLLSLLELQVEGKTKMSIKDFISGYQNINGMTFE